MSGGYVPIGAVRAVGEGIEAGAGVWRFAAGDGTRAEIALLAEDLARVRLVPAGREAAASWAVAREEWLAVDARVEREDSLLSLTTAAMRVQLHLDPYRVAFAWPDGTAFAADDPERGMGIVPPIGPEDLPDVDFPVGSVHCTKRLEPGARIFGCGERTSPLDKRGEHLVFYNVDPPQPHGADTRTMYVSIPFWLTVRDDGRTYGIFMDSVWKSALDAGASRPDALSFGVAGGDLTYYVFAGPTPSAVLARYADLTGHMPLPPRWALGYGQCRWSYYPEDEVRHIAEQYRARHIPCDSVWLDIDYMDGYRVFTWNPWRFPDPEKLVRELGAEGFKVVTIIDPGVKADPTDATYQDGLARDYFVRRPDGRLFIGAVWPGESVFADFSRADVRAWWGERHRALLDAGVAGIWDDMNEPALTDIFAPGAGMPHETTMPPDVLHRPDGPSGPAIPHAAFHNAYGMQMARATFEGLRRLRPDRRPFVLSRAGYAGIQRYAAVWTGDNRSQWDHMRLAARMCLGLGLSGLPFVGFDTGGFWLDASGEMLVRFTQLGAVFPFFRNHSAIRTQHQEPWQRGQPYEALIRAAIELRYRLLPYIYTAVAEAARTGAPITRPLVYAYPDEPGLATVEDVFLLGSDLLVAPILEEDQIRRAVQLPPGAWQDWLTGERFIGPRRIEVDAPLDVLPIFVREGAVVPLGPVMEWVGQLAEEPLTLTVYLGPHPALPGAGRVSGEANERGAAVGPHPALPGAGRGPAAAGSQGVRGLFYEDDGESPAYEQGAWRRTRYTVEVGPSLLPPSPEGKGPHGEDIEDIEDVERAGADVGAMQASPSGPAQQEPDRRTITLRAEAQGRYDPGPREHTIELHLPHPDPVHPPQVAIRSVRLNGDALAISDAMVQRRRYDTLVRVPLGRLSGGFTADVALEGTP